ncbi:hypothetical protein TCAL_15350 [Tigriopus californicus]|uniref:Uncharacterized protein n=1 Tax=Tigriopus californicus TaxID=6832 RepID=A0A553PKW9_TIGCA|nr:hypothetical protein TCAL_15350 [Tigriopus californicus]
MASYFSSIFQGTGSFSSLDHGFDIPGTDERHHEHVIAINGQGSMGSTREGVQATLEGKFTDRFGEVVLFDALALAE